jgi:hypothetical protein
MFKNGFVAVAAAVFLLAGATGALALDPIPQKSGFSGFIHPGAGYLSIESNTVAKVLSFDLSDEGIDDLGDGPDSESTAIFTVPYNLAYTFAGSRTQLFLGTELGDLLAFDTAQQLGVKQEAGSLGVFQAGFLFSDRVKVWRDPYLTGRDRDATGRRNIGGQLVWDKIFGSNLELEYSLRQVDINNESSGDSIATLSNAQRDRLDRNGTVHRASAGYGFTFGGRHTLRPQLTFFYEDLDGEAMANTGADLQLTYIYGGDPVSLVLNGFVGQADYDKSNPIYGRTREDDRYGASATVYYKNPWGWSLLGSDPMQFFVTGAYYAVDANIDFYDQQAILGLGGVVFRWR